MKSSQAQLSDQENGIGLGDTGAQSSNIISTRNSSIEDLIRTQGKTLETTLNRIFPDRQEETQLQKARQIMGEDIAHVADEELEVYLTEFQYLINSWLDAYEKEQFNGLTLQQMLREE